MKSCRVKKPRLAPLDVRVLGTTGATPVPSHDRTWSPGRVQKWNPMLRYRAVAERFSMIRAGRNLLPSLYPATACPTLGGHEFGEIGGHDHRGAGVQLPP